MSVKVDSIVVPARTTNGTQDITIADFGTPKAVLTYFSFRDDNDTPGSEGRINVGFTDGTNHSVLFIRSADNEASSNAHRGANNTTFLVKSFGAFEANFDSWITDGLRLNWVNSPSNAILVTYVFFGGEDVSAKVDTITVSSGDLTTTDVTVGFDPDLVIILNNEQHNTSTTQSLHNFGVGARGPDNTILQSVTMHRSQHNQATTNVRNSAFNNRITGSITTWQNSINNSVELSNWITNGFELTLHAGQNSNAVDCHILALSFNGKSRAHVGTLLSRTTIGLQVVDDIGWKPQVVGIASSGASALGSPTTQGKTALGVASLTNESSSGATDENNVGTTNTNSINDTKIINMPLQNGADGHKVVLDEFNANGFNLDYLVTEGTARYWTYWAIEEFVEDEEPETILGEGIASTDTTLTSLPTVIQIAEGTVGVLGQLNGFALLEILASGQNSSISTLNAESIIYTISSGTLSVESIIEGSSLLAIIAEGQSSSEFNITSDAHIIIYALGETLAQSDITALSTLLTITNGVLEATSELTALSELFNLGQGNISANTELLSAGKLFNISQGSITGASELNALAKLVGFLQGNLTVSSELLGSSVILVTSSGDLSANSNLEGVSLVIVHSSGNVSVISNITAESFVIITGNVAATASFTLVGEGVVIVIEEFVVLGDGTVTATSLLNAASILMISSSGEAESSTTLDANAIKLITNFGELESVSAITGTPLQVIFSSGLLDVLTSLISSGQVVQLSNGTVLATSTITGSSFVVIESNGLIESSLQLQGTSRIIIEAEALLVGEFTLIGDLISGMELDILDVRVSLINTPKTNLVMIETPNTRLFLIPVSNVKDIEIV